MRSRSRLAAAVGLAFLALAGSGPSAGAQTSQPGPLGADYRRAIEAWRAEREEKLTADDGWLTLVGLFWLDEGPNRVGSDPGAEVALAPGSAAASVGTITFHDGVATFTPAPGGDVRIRLVS